MATAAGLVDGDPAPASAQPAAQPPVPRGIHTVTASGVDGDPAPASAQPVAQPSVPRGTHMVTASGLVDGDPAPASAQPAAHPPVPPHRNYKNLLQELLQRAHKNLPNYYTECKGKHHQLKFRCIVKVDGEEFSSDHYHSRIKDAEQDSARAAYDILVQRKESADVNVTDELELIDQDVMFSKSILHEFAVKTAANQPSYSVSNPEELGPMPLFVASVLFAGNTYTGEYATNKKDAEQKAARAVVKSILATKNTCMVQIIRSKKKLITAITSSGYNKERGTISQEINSTPTGIPLPFSPIKFTAPVLYESYGGPGDMVPESQPISSHPLAVQEPNIMPVGDPSSNSSAQAMHVSKRRKKNKIRGVKRTRGQ